MVRPIIHSIETVFALLPSAAPGASVTEIESKVTMSKAALRQKLRDLAAAGRVVRVAPLEPHGTPRYHRPVAAVSVEV